MITCLPYQVVEEREESKTIGLETASLKGTLFD